jgi:hypothetical protein
MWLEVRTWTGARVRIRTDRVVMVESPARPQRSYVLLHVAGLPGPLQVIEPAEAILRRLATRPSRRPSLAKSGSEPPPHRLPRPGDDHGACESCGAVFEKQTPWQRFCASACRYRARYWRQRAASA